MNANLIHKWLKDPRFAPFTQEADDDLGGCEFLPIEVDVGPPSGIISISEQRSDCADVYARCVDITLSDGRRILIEGPTELSSVIGLVRGLQS